MKRISIAMICLAGVMLCNAFADESKITQEELSLRTQKMFDAVAIGDKTPWQKYIADDALYFDEKGRNLTKSALVADIEPLPKGYSGTIRLTKVQCHIEGNVAIMSYDLDEKETIFGQELSARYHETDTWMLRNGQWQIVAGQVLRYYEDPAPGKVDPHRLAEYAGTYQLGPEKVATVFVEDGKLYRQRGSGARELLEPEACDIFFRKGIEGRILFHLGEGGKVDALIDRRNNEDVVWRKVK